MVIERLTCLASRCGLASSEQ